MTFQEQPAWIYGFWQGGHWLYVGSSMTPHNREKVLRKKLPWLKKAQFRLIRKIVVSHAGEIEKQVIIALKRRGQAIFNLKASGSRPGDYPGNSGYYLWLETGRRFTFYTEIARHFDFTISSVRRADRRSNGKPFTVNDRLGVTFQRTQ